MKKDKKGVRLWAAAVWLAVWEAVSVLIGHEILLASPLRVLARLFELGVTAEYWQSVMFSLFRIAGGFLLALACGCAMGVLASRFTRFRELLAPAMATIKATPVASFIILVLIWLPSRGLSVFISFLMVLPVIYTNVCTGIECTDSRLLEMARVFRVPRARVWRVVYLSQAMPHIRSACSVALGLSWKAGIAAEVIGIPRGSIGERLYSAKIYLETPDLFAWTLTVILASLLFERLFLFVLDAASKRIERM